MHNVLIKICGLKRIEDVEVVNKFNIDFAGFIVDYPKSHRSIDIKKLKILTSKLDRKKIKACGVFVDKPCDFVINLLNENIIDIAQLHGKEDNDYIDKIKKKTRKTIIEAFEIKEQEDIDNAFKTLADFPLLDGGKGEGLLFDHKYALNFKRKFFLAGGLNEYNVLNAIKTLNPYAVDLSSSLEDENKCKSEEKIAKIIKIIRNNC